MNFEWNRVTGCIDSATNTATLKCLPAVFQNVVYGLLLFAGVGAMVFIILGGFKFMTAGGDPKQIDEGKKTLIYAIVGLLIIMFSFLIINIVGWFTGLNCISAFGFGNCPSGV